MRIGMLTDTYKPYISGVTNHVSLNKIALESVGNEVMVFTFGGQDYVDEEDNIIRSPAVPLSDTGYNLSFRYSKTAQKLLSTVNIAHVHHPFASGRLALRYCQNNNIPIVFTNHTRYDLYAQAYLPHLPEAIPEAFLQAFLPSFCKQCDLVIAPSPSLKTLLRSYGVDANIKIVPNGVDINKFSPSKELFNREEIGLNPNDLVLIYVGRLSPEKSLTMMLRAFAGAQSAIENLKLIIVGEGSEFDNLRDWCDRVNITNLVRFTGKAAYNAVSGYLNMADAFITPSVSEVHPLSIIEGMAVGLPAIGIDSPGVGDIIEDGTNGMLCKNNIEDFTAKLVRLMLDKDFRNRLSKGAIETSKQYDINHTSSQLYNHYEKLVINKNRNAIRKRNKINIGKIFK